MSMHEHWSDFEKWYKDFEAKHCRSTLVNEVWFNKVQKEHQGIRELIGGVRVGRKINLAAAQQAADKKACQPLFARLQKLVPNLVDHIPDGDVNKLLLPTISLGSHRAIRTGKAILTWAENNINDHKKKEKLSEVGDIVSKLGQSWARSRNDNVEHEVLLSTSARAFTLLGHYGADDESCFRQGAGNQHYKFNLAQCENSYVILIKDHKSRNAARMWGFPNRTFSVFNICNVYFKEGVQEGNMIETLKHFFANLIGKSPDSMSMFENKIAVGEDVYQNDYGNWSFTAQKSISEQVLDTDELGATCPNCEERHQSMEGWDEVDGEMICSYCLENANECDLSHKLTFKETRDAVTADEKFISASLDALKSGEYGTYYRCAECDTYFHESLVTQVGSKKHACKQCRKHFYQPNKKRVYGYSRTA